jgi:hypothetical protein
MADACEGAHLSADFRVDGSATMYRLYDIGYTIALDRAAELLGDSTRGRIRPSRVEARAIEIRNPPLLATVGALDLEVAGSPRAATISAHLFDFGVCSLQIHVPTPPGLTWSAFVEVCAAIESAPALGATFDRELRDLVSRIAPAVTRPVVAPLTEEYKVYRIDRINFTEPSRRPVAIGDAFTDEDITALLIGERQRLSSAARRELIPHRFSYYEDDLTVLTWESALVIEPRVDDRDIEYLLEFANAQLLELREYDQQLDADLPALYDRAEAARARRSPRLAGRFRAVLSDLQTRVADVTETVEGVENALKITNDVYLARIYGAALELFRAQVWRRGIDRKLAILRDTYGMLNDEAQAARTELLEIVIVVLILVELLLALLRRSAG